MPALAFLKLSRTLACQGTQAVYAVLHPDDLASASDVHAVEDQESLTFRVSRLDQLGTVRPIAAQIRAGRVVTAVWDDNSFDEWRVGTVTQGRGEGGPMTVQCVPLWLDLVERSDSAAGKGWVSDLVGGTTRNYEYEITQRTASSILSAYVLPNCPAWVTLGTVDPTYVIPSLTVSRLTPGALVLAVRDALRSVDIPCEVQLRRNGSTDYKLDIVTQIGAAAATPVFHPGNSLVSMQMRSDPTLQATRILVKGGSNPDGLPGEWGRARWRGGAPSGATLALTDRNGGSPPIAFDNQFVGAYLLRVKTGRTFAITASNAAAGTVTLSSVSTIAADEDFEFRFTEPLTNTRSTSTRYAVSAVPDGTHITMGVSVPILADNQYADWYAKVWSAAVAGTVIITTRISASVAATDVITVASSAGVTTAHYVEFVQLDGAGEIPGYADHPTQVAADPVGYGVKVMELSKNMLGVTQLIPNAWMRTWSNSANPPDGWTIGLAGLNAPGMRQNINPAFTRYGGLSWRSTGFVGGQPYSPQIFVTPTFYHSTTPGNTSLSVRAYVYFDVATGDTAATMEVYALKGDGTQGATLGSVTVGAPSTYALGNATIVDVGTWVELKVSLTSALSPTGDPASVMTAPFGMQARILMSVNGGSTPDLWDAYIDGVEAYAFADCPSDAYEVGDATSLLQSANNKLDEVASPPLYYSFAVLDLARAFPTEYSRLALTIGANVRAADVEYGIDATVRLLKMERDLLDASKTQLTLANRPTLLTTLQSVAARRQTRIVAAIVAGQGTLSTAPAFVALPGATTLTIGAEIQTPLAAAPVVTLPPAPPPVPGTGTAETGAAVTFVPADPATTPTTTVTVGRPPTRQKPRSFE